MTLEIYGQQEALAPLKHQGADENVRDGLRLKAKFVLSLTRLGRRRRRRGKQRPDGRSADDNLMEHS